MMHLADFYNNNYRFIMLMLVPSATPKIDQKHHHRRIMYSMLKYMYHLSLMREYTVMLDTRRDKVNGIL